MSQGLCESFIHITSLNTYNDFYDIVVSISILQKNKLIILSKFRNYF